MQNFAAEARAQGAIAVMPSENLVTYNDAATQAEFEAPGISYYINDRFVESVPEDLTASLVELFDNVTSPMSLILIEPGFDGTGVQNNETAFGYRNTWSIWVWPFWERTAAGAEADGANLLRSWLSCSACFGPDCCALHALKAASRL